MKNIIEHTQVDRFHKIYSENWASSRHLSDQKKMVQTPQTKQYLNFIYPASIPYYSELNPVFLMEVANHSVLNRRPIWLVRDGLIPLLWFFILHPKPNKIKSKILVEKRFGSFVPEKWRKQAGTYEVVSSASSFKDYKKNKKSKNLLITGLIMDAYCALPKLESKLIELQEKLGKSNLMKSEKTFFLIENNYNLSKSTFNFNHLYIILICKYLGTNIKSLNFNYMVSQNSFAGYQVIDLNDCLLCADSFLLHKPLSQGAELFQIDPQSSRLGKGKHGKKTEYFPLSPFHGIKMAAEIDDNLEEFGFTHQNLEKLSHSFAVKDSRLLKRFPWPEWLADWCFHSVNDN